MMKNDLEWHGAAQRYLARLCREEWIAQGSPVPTLRKPMTRYSPSEYARGLIDCLNRNDEEGFKAIKMLEGYSSTVGV